MRNKILGEDPDPIRRSKTLNAEGLELVGAPNDKSKCDKFEFAERARSPFCAATKPRNPTTRVQKGATRGG